jgi:hypothetical protein
MRARWYVAIGALGYLVALAATAPASLVADQVLQRTVPPQALSVRRVSGTLGDGAADLFVAGRSLGRCSWRFRPQSLLRGRLGFDLALVMAGGRLEGAVGVGPGPSVVLQQTDGQLAVAELRPYMPPEVRPWLVGGNLSLQVQSAELEPAGLQRLDGVLVWRDAEVGIARDVNLGDLRLAVSTTAEGTMEGVVEDGGGLLEVRGGFVLTADGRYRGDVTLGTRPGAPPRLGETLAMLGRPDENGRTALSLQGSLF